MFYFGRDAFRQRPYHTSECVGIFTLRDKPDITFFSVLVKICLSTVIMAGKSLKRSLVSAAGILSEPGVLPMLIRAKSLTS